MEDVVLRELETLARERKEDVATIIAKAVKRSKECRRMQSR